MSPHTENWMVLDGIGSKFRISKDCVEDMRGPSRVCAWYSGGSLVKCWLPKQVTKSGNTARLLYAVRVNSTPSCAWSGSRWLKAQNSKSASRFRTHRRSISLIHRYGSPRNDSCPLFEQQLCIYCISKNRSCALLPSLSKNRGIDSTTNLLTLHNYITRKKKTKKIHQYLINIWGLFGNVWLTLLWASTRGYPFDASIGTTAWSVAMKIPSLPPSASRNRSANRTSGGHDGMLSSPFVLAVNPWKPRGKHDVPPGHFDFFSSKKNEKWMEWL